MHHAAALWRVRPGEYPRPPALSREHQWDGLSLGHGLGLAAFESMLLHGRQVGPVMSCTIHQVVHVPVTPWDGRRLGKGLAVRPFDLSCLRESFRPYNECPGRMWLLPPQTEDDAVLTDFTTVFDEIHRLRSGAASTLHANSSTQETR